MLTLPMTTTQDHTHSSRPAGYCHKLKSGLARLKTAVKAEYQSAIPGQVDSIDRALTQAETLAWSTPFPSLFFPAFARIGLAEIDASSHQSRS